MFAHCLNETSWLLRVFSKINLLSCLHTVPRQCDENSAIIAWLSNNCVNMNKTVNELEVCNMTGLANGAECTQLLVGLGSIQSKMSCLWVSFDATHFSASNKALSILGTALKKMEYWCDVSPNSHN